MIMYKLTVAPQNIELWLPAKAPLTDIEYEPGGGQLIPFGCRQGACGACVIEILSGGEALGEKRMEESDFLLSLGFASDNFRLACQCRLHGAATIRLTD